MNSQSLAPRFGSLNIGRNSFDTHFHRPKDAQPYAVAEEKFRAFTDSKLLRQFSPDLDYLDKHFNVDIEIAVADENRPNLQYNVTFIEKDREDSQKDKRVHAFWSYVSEDPLRVVTSAITTAHRYYGKKLIGQRDAALQQVETLRLGIADIQNQARTLLNPKAEDDA